MKRKRQYIKRKHLIISDAKGTVVVWVEGYAQYLKHINFYAERFN